MGKASRRKQERRTINPPKVGKEQHGNERQRLVWAASGGLVVVIAVVAAVLLATRSTPKTAAPAAASPTDRNASAALVSAAAAVGFHPTTEPGVGEIEGQPITAATPPANSGLLATGSTAPLFTLKTPQGQKVSLAGYRGKAVLLEFFATWCPHCNAEAPHLRKLAASLGKNKVAFISVNADGETAPSVYAFHRYYGLPYPALLDPSSQPGSFKGEGAPGHVSTAYRVQSFPTFYVINPRGRIAFATDGEQPDALLRQELLKAARGA